MSRGFGSFGVGATDSIQVGPSFKFALQHSISLWKFSATSTGGGSFGVIFEVGGATTGPDINSNAAFSSLQYAFPFTGSAAVAVISGTVVGSAWQHIFITYDASNTANLPTAYVNGVKQTVVFTVSPIGTFNPPTSNIFIGNRSSANRNHDGMIAHFAMWNNVLLPISDGLALASGVCPLLVRPDALMVYAPLDGVNNPEPDLINGVSTNITGTLLGVSDPQSQLFNSAYAPFSDSGIISSFRTRRTLYDLGSGVGRRQVRAA